MITCIIKETGPPDKIKGTKQHTLLAIVPKQRYVPERYTANIFIRVYPPPMRNTCITMNDGAWPTVKPKVGILTDMEITDSEGMLAALGEIAFHWLNQHVYSESLHIPGISQKIKGNQLRDSCGNCKWFNRKQLRREEIHNPDGSHINGLTLSEMPVDLNNDRKYPAYHMCTLHGEMIEDMFNVMPEINRMTDGGVFEGAVNKRAGFGSSPTQEVKVTLPEYETVRQWQTDKDGNQVTDEHGMPVIEKVRRRKVMFQEYPTKGEEWMGLADAQSAMCGSKSCKFHRQKKTEGFRDIVPAGWMPRRPDGIKIAGGTIWTNNVDVKALKPNDLEFENWKEPEEEGIVTKPEDIVAMAW